MAGEIIVRQDPMPEGDADVPVPFPPRQTGALAGGEPFEWMNASGMSDGEVLSSVREVASQVSQWVNNTRAVRHKSSMFNRTAYAVPDHPYAQMQAARNAVKNDDVVGGAADVTEALMFDGLKFEGSDQDDADIANQLAADLNMDEFVRKAHRELFTCSQVVVMEWWGRKTYTVRGLATPSMDNVPAAPTVVDPSADPAVRAVQEANVAAETTAARKGRKRRRKYDLYCPLRLAVLDSTKVIPVGGTPFGIERLAWHATKAEMAAWDRLDQGIIDDPIMRVMFLGPYVATETERQWMGAMGIDYETLLELNPAYVWRHTYTRPDYEAWADIRLKGTFQWLDLKQQLMEADRAMLVGAANYILLIKKGSEQQPAHPDELSNLKEGFKVLAKLPVIVSDHRLEIEIITPKTDNTVDNTKYDTIDRRILGRCLGALSQASSGQRNENTLTISRFVGRLLESHRHMLKRVIEERIIKSVISDPRNDKAGFKSEPNMAFVPQRIELGTDLAIVTAIQGARASRDLSRNSFLEFLGFDEEVEAQRMAEEAERFDAIFKTQVPFNGQDPNAPAVDGATSKTDTSQSNGAQGGRPAGGGSPSANAAEPKAPNTKDS